MASVDQPFQTDEDSGQQNNASGGSQSTSNSSISQPQTQITTGTGTVGGGPGSTQGPQGGAAGPQGGSANSGQATSSGAYPSLSKYMAANQNWTNSNGQSLGQEVAGNLNNQGNQVNQSIQNAQNSFQNQGNNWENSTANNLSGFQSGLNNSTNYVNGSNANQDMQQASSALNASYQGPQNLFSENNNLQSQNQNYVNEAQQTQSATGQQNLLSQMFGGKGDYTSGQQQLDTSLLQTNPQSQQQLQSAFQNAQQTNQNLQGGNTAAQNQANAWTQYGQQAQQAAIGALNNTIGGLGSNMNQEYQTAEQTAPQQLAAAQAALNSGTISQAEANALGITNGEYFYNTNPGQYITQNALTQQNTVNQDQYNQMVALSQLAGLNSAAANPTSSQYLQTYSAANQPTSFLNGNYLDYNQAGLQNAINTAANTYNTQAQQYVNPIEQNMGDYASNVYYNNPGVTFNPYQGNVWVPNTGVGLNTNTLTATGSPVQTIMGPVNYSNLANQLLQQGENQVLANGPAGTQVANNLAEGQTQSYAGNYNSEQSLAYLNALSALMGLNQQMDASNAFNVT